MSFEVPEHAKRHLIFEAMQIGSLVLAAWWWFHLPVPGYAVAITAALAAGMSLHGEMKPWHKAAWMLLIGLFLVLEFRAISKDRHDYTEAESKKRDEEHKAFDAIATGINQTIVNSDRHFDATMERSAAILAGNTKSIKLAQESIAKITGGKSYGIVIPARDSEGPDQSLILEALLGGKSEPNPIHARIHFVEEPMYAVGPEMGSRFKALIFDGTIDPGQVYATTKRVLPSRAFEREYFIDVLVSNGATREKLEIRYPTAQGNILQYRYRVWVQGGQHNEKTIETTDWKTVEAFNNSVRQP